MSLLPTLVLGVLCSAVLGAQWTPADPPAGKQSGMPFFATGKDGTVYLSWTEPTANEEHALRFARWNGKEWADAETIATGKRWFVNWADFGSLQTLPDGSLLAHWLTRPENGGKYGYGIQVARRSPGPGGSWVRTAGFNLADAQDYAGFLSFSGSTAAYLSPPAEKVAPAQKHVGHDDPAHEDHIKTLRFASFGKSGELVKDEELDADVCSCCQTATAMTPKGLLVAFRDHLPGEIRDISIVRQVNGRWTKSQTLGSDGWKINGCPTEGPTIGVSEQNVAVAWLTRANETAKIQLAMSNDGSATFRQPIRVDDGNPLGRPSLLAISSDLMLLVWLEKITGGAEIRIRRVDSAGRIGPAHTVAPVLASRAVGLPKIALHQQQVLVAWRDGSVKAGLLPLSAIAEVKR